MLKINSTWKTKCTSQFNAKLLACPLASFWQTRFFLLLVFLSRAADLLIILPSILLWFTSSKSLSRSHVFSDISTIYDRRGVNQRSAMWRPHHQRGGTCRYQSNCSRREDSSRRHHSRSLTGTMAWCHQRAEIKDGRISPFLTASRVIIHPRAGPYVANEVREDLSEKRMNAIIYIYIYKKRNIHKTYGAHLFVCLCVCCAINVSFPYK